jgi:hypothetical protein
MNLTFDYSLINGAVGLVLVGAIIKTTFPEMGPELNKGVL